MQVHRYLNKFFRRGFDSHFGSWQLVTNYYTRMTESALVSNPDKVATAIVGVIYFLSSNNIFRWATTGTRMRSCPMRGGESSPLTWCPGEDQGDVSCIG